MLKVASVIIPAYNEQENIANTAEVISGILDAEEIEFEMIFADDGSKDGSWAEICRLNADDPRVRGLRFSRNFGKEGAIFAGLRAAEGDSARAVCRCWLSRLISNQDLYGVFYYSPIIFTTTDFSRQPSKSPYMIYWRGPEAA